MHEHDRAHARELHHDVLAAPVGRGLLHTALERDHAGGRRSSREVASPRWPRPRRSTLNRAVCAPGIAPIGGITGVGTGAAETVPSRVRPISATRKVGERRNLDTRAPSIGAPTLFPSLSAGQAPTARRQSRESPRAAGRRDDVLAGRREQEPRVHALRRAAVLEGALDGRPADPEGLARGAQAAEAGRRALEAPEAVEVDLHLVDALEAPDPGAALALVRVEPRAGRLDAAGRLRPRARTTPGTGGTTRPPGRWRRRSVSRWGHPGHRRIKALTRRAVKAVGRRPEAPPAARVADPASDHAALAEEGLELGDEAVGARVRP